MKKLLLTLVTLCVAVNSWGNIFAIQETFYEYDPENGYDKSIQYCIINNDDNNLTCAVLKCTRSGNVVIPGRVFTDKNKYVRVAMSGMNWGSTLLTDNIYSGDIETLTFSEGFTSFFPFHFRNCNAKKVAFPSTLTNWGTENYGEQINLCKIEIAEGCKNFKVVKTKENTDCVLRKSSTDATPQELVWALTRDEEGNDVTELSIPEGVTRISTASDLRLFAYNHNKGIKTLNLPASFRQLGKFKTYARTSLTNYPFEEITVHEDNPYFCSYDGIIYEKPFAVVDGETKPWGTKIYYVPERRFANTDTFTVPDGVTEITDVSFSRTYINNIILSDDVTDIGVSAFYTCTYLNSITIGKGVTTLGEGFLGGCTKLSEIIVENGNEYYASNLGSLYTNDYKTLLAYPLARTNDIDKEGNIIPYKLHKDCETLGKSCFGSSKIQAIDLFSAPNLKNFEQACFESCKSIKSLTIPASVETIKGSAMNQMTALESLIFESTDDLSKSLTIDQYCMSGINISEIKFPKQLVRLTDGDKLVSVGKATKVSFEDGSRLTAIGRFEKPIVEIDLSNCNQLTSLPASFVGNNNTVEIVKLPKSVTSIGNNAFFNTPNLQTIVFADGSELRNIGNNTFQGCGIRTIDLPNTLETLGSGAFAYCENLTSVNIPTTATYIAPLAFMGCNNLTKITVDTDNQTFASTDGMLASKDKKTLLIFPAGKASQAGTMISPSFETIGEYACYGCANLEAIIIPKKVTKINNHAFEFCNNLKSITFLGDVPPTEVEKDVAKDNKQSNYNDQDHRFGNADISARDFIKQNITINLRKNGNEGMYHAEGCYWNDAKAYTYSFSAKNGKNADGGNNEFDYLATSTTSVAVLGSKSTNYTALVPEKVINPDNGGKEYSVAIIGDYAFENMSPNVKEIVFLGPIELIGTNAFNNGHKDGYNPNPTSPIKQIVFANTESVGKCELSTQRFELGTEFGTDEYPEFTADQKIYVAKSKLSEYKENMPKFKNQIDYKIPGITIGSKYGTFSREFDVDLADTDGENWDAEKNRPKVAAFTGYVKTVIEDDMTYVVMRSINCNTESKESTGDGDGTYIPANTGVLLRAYTDDAKTPDGFYYRIGEQKSSYTAPAENVMMTVTENGTTINPTDGGYTNYIISGGRYYSLTSSVAIPVHKSYLHIPNVSNSKRLTLVFNDEGDLTTGIKNVTTDANDDIIYNLQGQRIYGSAKGMVIKNGKKIFVK